ncbi:WD40 repeat domain-containing protein [Streptomyces sp. NBC_00104]
MAGTRGVPPADNGDQIFGVGEGPLGQGGAPPCRLWAIAECRQLTALRGHENYANDVTWSPDEERVAPRRLDRGRLGHRDGPPHRGAQGGRGSCSRVACSPDGRLIAIGSDDRPVRVWASDTLEEIAIIGVHQDIGDLRRLVPGTAHAC